MFLFLRVICNLLVGFHLASAQAPSPILVCNDPLLPNAGDPACVASCGPTAISATCVPQGVCVCQYPTCTATDVVNPTFCPASDGGPFGPVVPQLQAFCAQECIQNECSTGTGVLCNTNDAQFGTQSWLCNCQCRPNPCPTTTSPKPVLLLLKTALIKKIAAFAVSKWATVFVLIKAGLAALIIGPVIYLKTMGILATILVILSGNMLG